MHKTTLSLVSAAFCVLVPLAPAQENGGMVPPAPELKKLDPYLGTWSGSGIFNDPQAGPTKWTSTGTYAPSHSGYWVQEDFVIEFEGMEGPMVFRAYLGWDSENKRYVNAHASNNGEVGLDEMVLQPDGSFVTFMTRRMEGMSYAERASSKVDGDKMTMRIDFLMAEGPSMAVVEGVFDRVGGKKPNVLGAGGFGPVNAAMSKLKGGAGVYDVKGSMTMAPGMPEMKIHGTDTYKMIFGGTVLHGNTVGGSDMMPGEYIADVFFGWNAKSNCYAAVSVTNMGQVGEMEMRVSADGKQLVSSSASLQMGQPALMRYVVDLAADGSYTKGTGHAIIGTAAPSKNFEATYTKKK